MTQYTNPEIDYRIVKEYHWHCADELTEKYRYIIPDNIVLKK